MAVHVAGGGEKSSNSFDIRRASGSAVDTNQVYGPGMPGKKKKGKSRSRTPGKASKSPGKKGKGKKKKAVAKKEYDESTEARPRAHGILRTRRDLIVISPCARCACCLARSNSPAPPRAH